MLSVTYYGAKILQRWRQSMFKPYYARKKLPDPPIVNTAQHTYFRIDFQRPYTLDRFCSRYMHGLAYGMA